MTKWPFSPGSHARGCSLAVQKYTPSGASGARKWNMGGCLALDLPGRTSASGIARKKGD
ncbi:MAG: hypothetical protein ACJ78Q_00545 [Chloroflexia bacterium]